MAKGGGAPRNQDRSWLHQIPVGYSYRGGLPRKEGMVIEGVLVGSSEVLRGASNRRGMTYVGQIRTGSCA